MQTNELTTAAMDAAEQVVGEGPVVMVNLLWFRDVPDYPDGFDNAKPNSRTAYYEGYAGAFQSIARELGIATQLIYAGDRSHGLIAGPEDDWDAIVIVRYDRFSDLKRIVESDTYRMAASPHRLAGVANWRFFATRAIGD